MQKNKNEKKKLKKISLSSKFLSDEPIDHLFIKLILVIVISSLFLTSLIYIMDRLWTKEEYLLPLNYSIANEVLQNKNSGITLISNSELDSEEDVIMCSMEYMPICARQNNDNCSQSEDCMAITYGNKCMAEAAKANIIHEGECQ